MPLQQIDPKIAVTAIGIAVKGKTLGIVSEDLNTLALDTDTFATVLRALATLEFRTEIPLEQLFEYPPGKILEELQKLESDIETKPLTKLDLDVVVRVFGLNISALLLGVNELRGFLENPLHLPSMSAARAHFLVMIIADLSGSYTDSGIQKWFRRRRTKLADRTPLEVLRGEWDPGDDEARRVRQLASSLVSLGAT